MRQILRSDVRGHAEIKEFFGLQSTQKVVRDEVAFAPAQDPNLAIINASRRFDEGHCLVLETTAPKQVHTEK
jgi:hypothetical protein